MKKLYSIPKALAVTAGLDLLLLGILLLFTHMVHKESGQALLFLTITLLLTTGICLFAVIPVRGRGMLWACMGVSLPLHTTLSVVTALVTGSKLSDAWPGSGDLAWLLILLMSLAVWHIGIFTVTVVRSRRRGKALREEQRNVKRASKGYTKEWQTLTPARGRTLAILRGALWVMWIHLLTFLFIAWFMNEGLEDTVLSYVSFPVLWSLMAAFYGLRGAEHRVAYTLSAAITNVLLFLLPTTLLTVAGTPVHKYRFVLHLDSVLTNPLDNPEQMLVIGVFLTVWVAMIVFGVGHKKPNSEFGMRNSELGERENGMIPR